MPLEDIWHYCEKCIKVVFYSILIYYIVNHIFIFILF